MKRQFWTDLWWLMVYAFVGLLVVVGLSAVLAQVTQGTVLLHLVQWAQTLLLMALPPVLWVKWYKKESVRETMRLALPSWQKMALTALLMVVCLPLLSTMEEGCIWLCDAVLPASVREWAAEMQRAQEAAIQGLLAVDGWMGWCELILLMSVATAVGEELMFRGALLRCFVKTDELGSQVRGWRLFWIACCVGLIFSAFHFDLYGLLPRWVLGTGFVYLVAWSGSIWPAVLAHAINNLFALLEMKEVLGL